MSTAQTEVVLSTYDEVKAALLSNSLVRSVDPDVFERGNIMERVLLVLVDGEHRDRRRAENPLFRRERLAAYETKLFLPIIESTFEAMVTDGRADLVDLGAMLTVVLSGQTAGIDLNAGSLSERRRLVDYLHVFARGEALDVQLGDVEGIKAEVRKALARFSDEYFIPSRLRRLQLLEAGRSQELPADLLTLLLNARHELRLDHETILRETAFFFEAGAHTSTQTFTNTLHCILSWMDGRVDRTERLRSDLALVQRCVHEALRLRPTNPGIRRRATQDVTIGDTFIPRGSLVVLDTATANRDRSVFGLSPDEFNPERAVPGHATRYGHSFGGGAHACMGRILAVGQPIGGDGLPNDHLFGLVSLMVQFMIQKGIGQDPDREAVPESGSLRWTRWRSYPVTFNKRPAYHRPVALGRG